jgi:2-haloacid dehalogenase
MTPIDRRSFVASTATALMVPLLGRVGIRPASIRAVAFDGFALFDATAVVPTVDAVVPGRGRELLAAWRARHFQYQWLRTMGGQYADFQRTADDALAFSARSLGVALSDADRAKLVDAQAKLQPWPDAVAAVRQLNAAGIRLSILSNMTESMLDDGLRRSGMRNVFEFVLSTDRVRAAKPSPAAYDMGPAAFRLPREQIAFVGFAGWDVAGAVWYGYPTVWLNKGNAPAEELGAAPRLTTQGLASVGQWLLENR